MIIKLLKLFKHESTARMRKRLRNALKNDYDVMVSKIKFEQGNERKCY